MFVKRSVTWEAFARDWCPACVKKVVMKHIQTHLPGIAAQQCPECKSHYQTNYLEDGEDLLEVADNLIFEENATNDPFQVKAKLEYILGERNRLYATKKEMTETITEMVWGYFEDTDCGLDYKLRLGIEKGEFTLDELVTEFRKQIEEVLEEAEPDEED